MNGSKKRRNKVSNKKRRFLFYADRCVEEWIRDRWVCCLFGSGARSCVKMKGETRATRPDERTRKTNEEWAAPEKKETVSNRSDSITKIEKNRVKRDTILFLPFFLSRWIKCELAGWGDRYFYKQGWVRGKVLKLYIVVWKILYDG